MTQTQGSRQDATCQAPPAVAVPSLQGAEESLGLSCTAAALPVRTGTALSSTAIVQQHVGCPQLSAAPLQASTVRAGSSHVTREKSQTATDFQV